MGYPYASLTIVNTDAGPKPQLKYLKGNNCPHDPATQLSSQIEFYCNATAGKVSIFPIVSLSLVLQQQQKTYFNLG